MKVIVEKKIGDQVLSFETGHWAKQAGATVVVRYGETVVLCAVTSGSARLGIDFFPLTCDYRERTAAAGKFPGGFMKREGRPTLKETLTSRLIDRPIRPLFADGFKDEVQCQSMVLASDRQIWRIRCSECGCNGSRPTGNGLFPFNVRLPRTNQCRRKISRRIYQTGRSTEYQGNFNLATD